ncbi:Mitochondrial mRNA pseudouridine synthase [Takifugu flavidus]|uniref:Mitochondrial mRNA pseudouridine synthase n=1 Tax=Takifugu flavidus TaxID=433684 RepID=A0A5C6N444_9TELE|nr:Mitochondrial mRNA pseudouridine synthase [Takifugu flavidus]
MATPAIRMLRRLEGIFSVYKPSGVHWKLVRDTIETNIRNDLNATPSQPLPHKICFLNAPGSETEASRGLALRTVSLPVLSKHPLDHITQDKLERVLAMLEGANQKALLMYSNVDMKSQDAYEMAARGLLGPDGKSPPILKGLRCIHFQPPNFTLEVQCLNDTQKYLRRIVHEIGLELRSTAVCKGVRRTRDGPFTLKDALVHQQWTAADIMQAVRQYHASKKRKKSPPTKINHTSTAVKRQEEHEICNETPAVI